jgi:hypothetical protein
MDNLGTTFDLMQGRAFMANGTVQILFAFGHSAVSGANRQMYLPLLERGVLDTYPESEAELGTEEARHCQSALLQFATLVNQNPMLRYALMAALGIKKKGYFPPMSNVPS